jgi:hypothetical protein
MPPGGKNEIKVEEYIEPYLYMSVSKRIKTVKNSRCAAVISIIHILKNIAACFHSTKKVSSNQTTA